MTEQQHADILFRGAYVVTLDDQRRVYRNGYVAITGNRITAVGPDSDCAITAGRTINARGKLIMPGMADAHNHLNQIVARGKMDDLPRGSTMTAFIKDHIDLWKGAGDEISYRINRLHLLDKLKGGTTATHDQHFTNIPGDNIDGVLRALDDSGMRAFVSRCLLTDPVTVPPEAIETVDAVLKETERLQKRWNSNRITVTSSPINPSWVATGDELKALREGVRALGVPFDIDLSGDLWRETMQRRGWAGGAVEYCDHLGILDDQTLGGKSFQMLPSEYAIWAKCGLKACMVPMGRIRGEGGIALHHFLAVGVVPAIGTDSTSSHPTTSLWDVMRLTAIATTTRMNLEAQAGNTTDHQYQPTTELLLEMATLAGARSLFLEDAVNGLAAGKAADLITVDIDRPAFYPTQDGRRLLSTLVWCTEAPMVDTVMVDGRILVEGGKSTIWDEEQVLAEAEEAVEALVAKAGMDASLPRRGAGETYRGWTYI